MQIEKFNSAANTFYGKYGALPGDLNNQVATTFGFAARGSNPGAGDDNGILEWDHVQATTYSWAGSVAEGEMGMFWVDMTYANGQNLDLIEGSFSSSVPTGYINGGANVPSNRVSAYLPPAKIGNGNYVYVWSGGVGTSWDLQAAGDGKNYFGISTASGLGNAGQFIPASTPGLTVKQAFDIDQKIDDGLPQSGNVKAQYVPGSGGGSWSATPTSIPWLGPPSTAAISASSTTCYDNGGNAGTAQHYSIEISNGSNVNCALSFKMQAGD